MNNDYIAPIIKRLTINGAINLKATVERPDPQIPDQLNGGYRTFTGLGKWTHLSARGVDNHLLSLGLIEARDVQAILRPVAWSEPWFVYCLTPLGMEVARYLAAYWDEIEGFRDPEQERRGRDQRRAAKLPQSAVSGGTDLTPGDAST